MNTKQRPGTPTVSVCFCLDILCFGVGFFGLEGKKSLDSLGPSFSYDIEPFTFLIPNTLGTRGVHVHVIARDGEVPQITTPV